jgi:hypothetical protein
MIPFRSTLTFAAVAAGCLMLASCAASSGGAGMGQAPAGLHEITPLYELATRPQAAPQRKPVRDQRARAMRMLAEKTDELLAQTSTWDTEVRLTSLAEHERAGARREVSTFRSNLQGLKAAADNNSVSEVRRSYAATMASYRHLSETLHLPAE